MKVVSEKDDAGEFVKPLPFVIERADLDYICSLTEDFIAAKIVRYIEPILGESLAIDGFNLPTCDTWGAETTRKVQSGVCELNRLVGELRREYFSGLREHPGAIGAHRELAGNGPVVFDIPEQKKPTTAPAKMISNYRSLLSTRAMLVELGGKIYYDGPDFRFDSRHHPSPKESYLPKLAEEYLMRIFIPNCLLANKFGYLVDGNLMVSAMSHCMTTGKSRSATEAWERKRNEIMGPVIERWNFYMAGKKADGTFLPNEKRCYFDKYVSLHSGEFTRQYTRGKCQDRVRELLARVEKEPELLTMSHRELLAKGIGDRTARQFMKARSFKCKT